MNQGLASVHLQAGWQHCVIAQLLSAHLDESAVLADASAADAHLGTDENSMLVHQKCQPLHALMLVHSLACSVSAADDDAPHEAAALMSTDQLRHLQSPDLMCNPPQSQQMPAHRTGRPLSEIHHATLSVPHYAKRVS